MDNYIGDRIYFPVECCPKPNSLSGTQKDFELEPAFIKVESSQESDEEMDTSDPLENDLDEDSFHSISSDDLTKDDDKCQMAETIKIVESSSIGQKILINVNQPQPTSSRKSHFKLPPAQVLKTPISKCPVPVKMPRLNLSFDHTLSCTKDLHSSS